MNKAYGLLEIKALDDEQRVIYGLATSPTPDRMGDIVEPLGVEFKNPMPLLWQHRHDSPVGTAYFDRPNKNGVTFKAVLPRISEDGQLKNLVDMAWHSVKEQLVRGVSIGFRALERAFLESGGVHFIKTEVIELSLVTIPANSDANIMTVKAMDIDPRCAGRVPLVPINTAPAATVKPGTIKLIR